MSFRMTTIESCTRVEVMRKMPSHPMWRGPFQKSCTSPPSPRGTLSIGVLSAGAPKPRISVR
jgi:hypothetical protein